VKKRNKKEWGEVKEREKNETKTKNPKRKNVVD
jgi:hypothetical protein